MNDIKYIYEFSIDVLKEIEKTEQKEENGVITTITSKVKEKVPMFFAFKKPSRAEREDAEDYRVKMWGEFVKKGVMPEAILLKNYSNYGGILSDDQRKNYQKMRVDYGNKLELYQLSKISKDEKSSELMGEIITLRDNIISFEREQNTFFENTAEAKSRNKLIEYILLNMFYYKDNNDKLYEIYFKGNNLSEKYDFLEHLEETENEIYLKIRDRLAFVASLYVSLSGNIKKEDIEEFTNQLIDNSVNG